LSSSEDPTNEQWLIDSSESFESLFNAIYLKNQEEVTLLLKKKRNAKE
jgi:hypothetical protein